MALHSSIRSLAFSFGVDGTAIIRFFCQYFSSFAGIHSVVYHKMIKELSLRENLTLEYFLQMSIKKTLGDSVYSGFFSLCHSRVNNSTYLTFLVGAVVSSGESSLSRFSA